MINLWIIYYIQQLCKNMVREVNNIFSIFCLFVCGSKFLSLLSFL